MESQLFRPRNVVQKCYGRPWVFVMVWQMKERRNKQDEPKAFVNCGLRQRFIRWARMTEDLTVNTLIAEFCSVRVRSASGIGRSHRAHIGHSDTIVTRHVTTRHLPPIRVGVFEAACSDIFHSNLHSYTMPIFVRQRHRT